MKLPFLRRAGALLLALALACSLLVLPAAADDTVPVDPIDPTVTGVELDRDTLTMKVGEKVTLKATLTPSSATNALTWSSSDSTIASVTQDGLVTALKAGAGPATITVAVSNSDKAASCEVTVEEETPPPSTAVSEIILSETSLSIHPGGSATITATVKPETAADKTVYWQSSDYQTARLAPNGNTVEISVPSTVEVGKTATVWATSTSNKTVQALCSVTVSSPPPPEITSVSIISPDTDQFHYVDPGKSITLTASVSPSSVKDPTLDWTSADNAIARARGNGDLTAAITGVAPGVTEITVRAGGPNVPPAVREVETSGILLSYIRKSTSGGQGTTVNLTRDTVVDIFQYRDISVTARLFGNARNNLVNWESSNNSVAQVVSGRVTANYPGDAVITASAAGTGFSASFKVHVSEDVADAINVNMGSEPSYALSGILSQLNARSQSKAGGPLDYVYNLKVSTENGVLYYRYNYPETPGHGVGGTERYYYQPSGQGQMGLRDVTFVPLPGFSGTAVVDYNAASTNGTNFTGTIRIEATSSGDVSYSTEAGQPVSFAAEHFSEICRGRNGRSIRYVTFSLPSTSRGTLYFNYSPNGQFSPKVTSDTRYYATSKPSIDNISFVPAEGYVGNVEIPYRCVDSAGSTYSGTVTVRVYGSGGSGNSSGGSDVEYYIARNQQRTLNAADFNAASRRATGSDLSRVRFDSLPASGAGTLYLNYSSGSSTRVSAGTSYYRSSTPRISNITFVPASGYSGAVSIPFTGTNSKGSTFTGRLTFYVGDASGGTGSVYYTTQQNRTVPLSAWDFNAASQRVNGVTLSSVRFTSLPSSGAGALYYNYAGTGSTGTRVTANTDYRRNGSPALSSVTFVPAAGYAGTVSIPFTGYDDNGGRFTGSLIITVEGGTAAAVPSFSGIRYTGSSTPVSLRTSDFQNACRSALGNALSYVQFNSLPSVGRLYQNYNLSSRTGTAVSAGTRYGAQELGQISYVPKAEYQGTLTIPYTLYDTQGGASSGSMEIQLSNGNCYASFSDTASGWDWAKPSIEYLRSSGITTGYSNNTYRPAQSISRGEFTLMVCRAFQFPTTGSSGFPDVPDSSAYAGAIATARDLGIVQGNNGRFQPDRPITRQSAMTMICRALEAAGQSVPAADVSLLSSYADGGQVSAFARPAVASLIQMGAVRGNSSMRLNPTAAISRAEMAVILHRVLAR